MPRPRRDISGTPGVLAFSLDEVGASYFVASWRTDVPCRCRMQVSTSHAMVDAMPVDPGAGLATEFTFDSRKSGSYGHLPAMARYWVRVLAEDDSGREGAGPVTEVLLPEGPAATGIRALPLGGGAAVVEWSSDEPTRGQVSVADGSGAERWTPLEPTPRRYHCVGVGGLKAGGSYEVRIRQSFRREKWGDQTLRSHAIQLDMPADEPCLPGVIRVSDDCVVLCHEKIRVVIDSCGGVRAFLVDDGRPVTVLDPTGGSAFALVLADGAEVSEFADGASVSAPERVPTEFGDALRVSVTGTAELAGTTLTRTIHAELYDDQPDAVVFRVSYRADGGAVSVKAARSLDFRLDRRLALGGAGRAEAWHFASYQPVSTSKTFGKTYTVIPLEPGFRRENSLAGAGDGADECCGVPVFDFWCRETGVAIGHLSDVPIRVSFPVEVGEGGLPGICMLDERVGEITPEARYDSPPLMLAVHRLDFYDGVSRFRELMAARGLKMAAAPAEAYEPAWSTWGYTKTFTKADVLRAAPVLKELGIDWIQFDDPWYANHGDFEVNRDIFPGGEEDLKGFIAELREMGFKLRLWICSGHASSGSAYAKEHPERLIRGADGSPVEITGAGFMAGQTEHELCPGLEENVEFSLSVVERHLKEYGTAALYQDGIYGTPPCFDPSHGHADPYETAAEHAELYRRIGEGVAEMTGGRGVVMLCTCGKVPDFYLLPHVNRVATADPMPVHVRKRVKSLKALMGPTAAVDFDFVEVTQDDFAGVIGTGACIYVKFTVPLEEADHERYRRWLALAREHGTARGEYLNLYDIAHDRPEAHAVRVGGRTYYAFFASEWSGDLDTPYAGTVELRGLEPRRRYAVRDYVNARDLGEVTGPIGRIEVEFRGNLLVFAEPAAD